MPKSVSKLTPHNDGKRRRMSMTKLTAVALTARGANPEANVTFFKSVDKPVEKGGDLIELVTSIDHNHQHAVSIDIYDRELYFSVSFAQGEEGVNGHYHHVTMEDDIYVLSTNANHTHTVDAEVIRAAIFDQLNKGIGEDTITKEKALSLNAIKIDGDQVHMEDNTMPKELQKELDTAEAKLVKAQADLKTAVALGSLNDAQKAHHATLNDVDKETFLGKSSLERQAELDEVEKLNPVEYTAEDGTEYRKSDGAKTIALAKRLDLQDTEMAKQAALTKQATLIKRAGTELKNLVGEEATKVALLRAIDTIDDDAMKTSIGEMFSSANSVSGLALETIGSQEPGVVKEASDALDTMAKAYAADKGVSVSSAYAKVLETAEGQKLYNEANA